MVFKAYFDGGNQADSTQYDVVTLASILGIPDWWRPFEISWKYALKRHDAPFLHTTDAVTLQNDFSEEKGWNRTRSDAFIEECVSIIENAAARPVRGGLTNGLLPSTISVVLKDFKRVQDEVTTAPKDATEVCSMQGLYHLFRIGEAARTNFYQLFFDRNEPFYKHAVDRWKNKKAKRILAPFRKVTHCGESDMRDIFALQAADLFA